MLLSSVPRIGSRWLCLVPSSRSASTSTSGPPRPDDNQSDLVIVGGGIVGAASARRFAQLFPHLTLTLVEKEKELAVHQSGRNSGVIHAGIYYIPGSLKAKLCVRGMDLAYAYCDRRKIPYKRIGKLIVAVEPDEVPRLDALYERGLENGVQNLELIDGSRIKEFEPHCKGLKAIWSPNTGIVDWGEVTKELGREVQEMGGRIRLDCEVKGFTAAAGGESVEKGSNDYPLRVLLKDKPPISCKHVIACGGLQSDRLAVLSGCSPVPKVLPFRGEYLLLKPEKRYLVRGNIYPVPSPGLPFLGVHFTPRMNGDFWLGPNAVLAYKREGYSYTDISLPDMFDALSFSGMQKLIFKHFGYGLGELARSVWTSAQVKQLQRFIPELQVSDVARGPSGVRAQALDADGSLVDDFVFDRGSGEVGSRVLHVRNAPSPAATSSLAIAEMIVERWAKEFNVEMPKDRS